MNIVTKEMLVETFIKNVLSGIYDAFVNDKFAHENCITFDEYVYDRTGELGLAVYDTIGEMYGDLDEAMENVR